MSRKETSLPKKVKNFFGKKETIAFNFDKLKKEPHFIGHDVLYDISSENSTSHRLKVLRDLYDIVITKKLDNYAVESICKCIEDMLDIQHTIETRHTLMQFMCAIICGQMEDLVTMRAYFFRMIVQHNIEDDVSPRFDMLKALSDNGKNISYFEEEIGPFLLSWFPSVMATDRTAEFLSLLTNVVKFNAAYLEDDVIFGFISQTSTICNSTKVEDEIEECLNLLEAVLCYSHLPSSSLCYFIYTLCLTVNLEKFVQCSWKHMRNLIGTNVGHTCIFSLCTILQERNNYSQCGLLRGAIFFIGMALWGPNRVPTLIHRPAAVLPSFLKVLESKEIIIAYEVTLALQRLVQSGEEIQTFCWDIIFDIVEDVLEFAKLQEEHKSSVLSKSVHELITAAEKIITEPENEQRLYKIVDQCSNARTDESVMHLISYTVKTMHPFKCDFLIKLNHLLEKYFKNEKRSSIQLEVLKAVNNIRENYGFVLENEVVDQGIAQQLVNLENVSDLHVKKAAVELLIDVLQTSSSGFFTECLIILEKLLSSVFDHPEAEDVEHSYSDILMAIEGLIKVYKKIFVLPFNESAKIYTMLITHLTQQYTYLPYHPELTAARKLLLEFFLEFRANNKAQLGLKVDGSGITYSACTCNVNHNPQFTYGSPVPSVAETCSSVSYFSYGDAFQCLILCLKQEKNWPILELVLQELPSLLQNKALIMRGNCSITSLCSTLSSMVNDKNKSLTENLKNAPPRLTRTDVHGCIYPCIAALASYHSCLESYMQRLVIRCLMSGLVSRSAKLCIDGLAICTLEMQNSMVKLLPDVLLKLSKISSTVGVAISVLEFLSNLIRLPNLYVSFVEDQYMSIFAIALPYTNPFKFNQYIVALSHHVIALWFLKCRIPFRKDFAKFITKGLSNNIHLPRDDVSVLTDQGSDSSGGSDRSMSTEAIITLHKELMETGLDLMARFTFGMASNVPRRSPVSDLMLEKGQKCSWLLGNKIVTITTSGCSTKPVKNGLCERCYSQCFHETDSKARTKKTELSHKGGSTSMQFERKRHRSAIQKRTLPPSGNVLAEKNQAKDDILIDFKQRSSGDADQVEGLVHSFSKLSSDLDANAKKPCNLCSCWCTNWAEVHIRRPTGNTSWIMKIQNQLFLPSNLSELPLSLISSMVLQDSSSSLMMPVLKENYELLEEESASSAVPVASSAAIDIIPSKSKMEIRRTNSSPDMNILCSSSSTQSTIPDEQDAFLDPGEMADGRKVSEGLALPELQRHASVSTDIPTEEKVHSESQALKKSSFRDRGHTISVMSPIHPQGPEVPTQRLDYSRGSGMNPSFVFLQLYHNSCFGPTTHKPLLLQQSEANNRALDVLDHIPPYDTHKIGVVYIGPGQVNDEVGILSNVCGSSRYVQFLKGLGTMVRLTDVDPYRMFLGGLDNRGEDGKYGLIWHDDVMQVVFHVATLMMNKEQDPQRNEKKKHIANDTVMIVYNESGEDYEMSTIRGHVTNACVIINPEDFDYNIVSVKLKSQELCNMFGHSETYTISNKSLPVFVRQLALHANLASLIVSRRQQSSMKYLHVSNWLERLRTIKRLRSKVIDELKRIASESSQHEAYTTESDYDNFTDYV